MKLIVKKEGELLDFLYQNSTEEIRLTRKYDKYLAMIAA